jgi:AI-2 transport protein TqsA
MVGNIIEPKIMGESLDHHPVVILLGLIFFGMIWGVIGMILATPIVAVLKIVLERMELTAPVARLLSGRLARDTPQPSG